MIIEKLREIKSIRAEAELKVRFVIFQLDLRELIYFKTHFFSVRIDATVLLVILTLL